MRETPTARSRLGGTNNCRERRDRAGTPGTERRQRRHRLQGLNGSSNLELEGS